MAQSLRMTRTERNAFLAETHVGVVCVADPPRGPLAVPVWYNYEPGGVVRLVTAGTSQKATLLAAAGRASLCVQSETPPYKYVTVEGPIELGPFDYERDVRQMAERYLGLHVAEMYLQMSAAELEGSVLVTLRPERWATVDYTKMG